MPNVLEITAVGYDPYAGLHDAGWFGSGIVRSVGSAAKGVAKFAKKITKTSAFKAAITAAQTGLKNSGPIGMAASGVIGAVSAGVRGESLANVGLAAVTGAAPSGIDTAISAGVRLARGEKVLSVALQEGAKQLIPGSDARFGYSVAADALKKGATKAQMGTARRVLANEEQRRSFDAAVGTLAIAAQKQKRPATTSRPTARPIVAVTKQRPALAVNSHKAAPRRMPWRRTSPKAAAFLRRHVPHAPLFALLGRDTGALAGGLVASQMPTVRSGASGSAVATLQATLNEKRGAGLVTDGKFGPKTLTAVKLFQGSAGLVVDGVVGPKTWAALDAAAGLAVSVPQLQAPSVSTSSVARPTLRFGARGAAVSTLQAQLNAKAGGRLKVDGIFGSLTLSSVKAFQRSRGLVVDGVVGPRTWAALDSAPVLLPSTAPAVVLPSINTPTSTDGTDTAAILQAKTILVAWSKTDGIAEGGFTDYGARAEDMSTSFGTRDRFMLASFAKWHNRTRGSQLSTSGELTIACANALRAWAEGRAAGVVVAPPRPGAPATQLPQLPASLPQLPASLPQLPASSPGLPVISQGPGGQTVITMPQDTINASPGQQPQPAAVASAEKMSPIVTVGGGAVIGGLIGGPMGAVLGAAAGAIASA